MSGAYVGSHQQRCAEWLTRRHPTDDLAKRLAKLGEEAGEVCRAGIGDLEHREGRGDLVQEAAQVILVLLSIVGKWYPDRDLAAEVEAELRDAELELVMRERGTGGLPA